MTLPDEDKVYKSLRERYLVVYLLASFADWLQGPYLYRLYANYGYERDEISLLYVTGFASGTILGLIIGYYADTFGRKKLCVLYSLTTTVNCLAIAATNDYVILIIARAFGGASTCILFSTFESWYVGEHLSRYKLNKELMGDVLARSTLYNGFLGVFAGFSSSLMADRLEYGPVAPFLTAIPVSLLSGYLCSRLWPENAFIRDEGDSRMSVRVTKTLHLLLFSSSNWLLLLMGSCQSIYETVLYVFVFLWSPVLEPINVSQGMIFGIFMLCVMIGSKLSSLLATIFRVKREHSLCISIALGTFGISGTTVGVYLQEHGHEIFGSWLCLFSFLVFELSAGIYYPSIGYIRGVAVPEYHRASILNWFRLPMNLFICLGLLYISIRIPTNFVVFGTCSLALSVAFVASLKLAKLFGQQSKYSVLTEQSQSFVL